ncbi:nucleolar protein 4-like isoform X2 [Periplaneta americana]|uniref:nucleolar protein 4-like isoform X2 n=1 Tax=Periplaneta americana TaxID=6978 RepID=UPI0037E77C68
MSSPMPLDRELRRRPSSVEPATTVPTSTSSLTMTAPKSSLTPTKSSPSASVLMLSPMKPPSQGHKRRSTSQSKTDEDGQQSSSKRRRHSVKPHITNGNTTNTKEDMFDTYQPWVIQTYGDSAKTKTITLRKYARVLRTLRGEESNSVENSKFRFWVKAKGFRIGQPPGYVAKPADSIVGSQTLSDNKEGGNQDPPLYVPTATAKDGQGRDKQLFKKVAVVENFFDIIYSVHVEMEGRAGKHAGQKRTYRTITETYAFLPREAVTRFLLGCTDCQRRPRSPSPITANALKPAPSPSLTHIPSDLEQPPLTPTTDSDNFSLPSPITVKSSPNTASSRRLNNHHVNNNHHNNHQQRATSTPMTLKPSANHQRLNNNNSNHIHNNNHLKKLVEPPDIDFSLPITTTYLKHMRSLGYTDEDALKIDVEDNVSTPEPDVTDDDHFPGRNGDLRLTDDREMSSDDVAGLWTGYHNALGLKKSTPPGAREQSSPLLLTQETGSVHDETSSSGNKEDEDDDEDEGEDKIDPQQYDPERLKAFNMFVRLFVDENLDRIVPISKQPKEKIQAIIDSCTRQFPEFAERARKRIRTYLKSCRRNKRSRETNGAWDATRPTPAHLTSVQAEQILAQACENESHNAKRMRLGLEPVSQPLPLLPNTTTDSRPASMDHYSSPVVVASDAATKPTLSTTANPTIKSEPPSLHPVDAGLSPAFNPAASLTKNTVSSVEAMAKSVNTTASIGTTVNGSATSSAAPTALYRPNFSQAFQRAAATGPYPNPLFPTPPFGSGGMISNGPTDLSMKTKPLLSHKLNTAEMAAVRQLITGYRESAAFLLRSADELEQLLLQQQ